jgi:hypothetical protein
MALRGGEPGAGSDGRAGLLAAPKATFVARRGEARNSTAKSATSAIFLSPDQPVQEGEFRKVRPD